MRDLKERTRDCCFKMMVCIDMLEGKDKDDFIAAVQRHQDLDHLYDYVNVWYESIRKEFNK